MDTLRGQGVRTFTEVHLQDGPVDLYSPRTVSYRSKGRVRK